MLRKVKSVHFTSIKWSRPWDRRRGFPKSPFFIPTNSAFLIQPMESISLHPVHKNRRTRGHWTSAGFVPHSLVIVYRLNEQWRVLGWGLCLDLQPGSYTWLGLLNPDHLKPSPPANCILLRWVPETGKIVTLILSIMCARHFEASFPLSYTRHQLQHMVQGSSSCSLFIMKQSQSHSQLIQHMILKSKRIYSRILPTLPAPDNRKAFFIHHPAVRILLQQEKKNQERWGKQHQWTHWSIQICIIYLQRNYLSCCK